MSEESEVNKMKKKPETELIEVADIIEDLKPLASSGEISRQILRCLHRRGVLHIERMSKDGIYALND